MSEYPIRAGRCDIRLADLSDSADAASYISLLDQYARDPMGGGRPLTKEVLERLPHDLAQFPGTLMLLASVDGQAVAVATCFTGYSTFRAAPLLNVHDIAVLPSHRGRGIGRAMLRAMEAHARERGCCKITLEVREDNPLAHGLYRSEGYGGAELGDSRVQYLFLEKALDSGQ